MAATLFEGQPQLTVVNNAEQSESSEVDRLLQRMCYTEGSAFRQDVIRRAKQRLRAAPFEIGVNGEDLLKHCYSRENKEWRYRLAMVVLFMIACTGLSDALSYYEDPYLEEFGLGWLLAAAVAFASLLGGYWHASSVVPRVREFNSRSAVSSPKVRFTKEDLATFPERQNIVVHHGFDPFSNAGSVLSRWNVAVDLARGKKNESGDRCTPNSFSAAEVETAIVETLDRADLPVTTVRSLYFIYGEHAGLIPGLLNDLQPKAQVDEEIANRWVCEYPDKVRRYLWLLTTSWQGEIEISSFVRCVIKGTMLHIEHNRYVLGPIASKFHRYDYDMLRTWRVWPGFFIGGMILGVVHLLWKPVEVFLYMQNHDRITKAIRQQRYNNPRFNVGSDISIRKTYSADDLSCHAQRVDIDGSQAALDSLLLSAALDFLEEREVDVSSIRHSTITVMNSGIIVRGGNVTAQALAVGDNSSSNIRFAGAAGTNTPFAKKGAT